MADLVALLSLVQHHIPGARLVEDSRRETVINLPQTAAKDSSLAVFLSELDRRLPELAISSYGLSDSTLEEVGYTFNHKLPVKHLQSVYKLTFQYVSCYMCVRDKITFYYSEALVFPPQSSPIRKARYLWSSHAHYRLSVSIRLPLIAYLWSLISLRYVN